MDVRLFFWLSIWLFGVSASQWYVSRLNGTIEDGCGLVKSRPCKYIYQATTLAHEGDVINIDGSGTSRDPYPCDVDTRMHIQHIAGISIASYTTQAFLACRNKSLQLSCDFRNSSSGGIFLEGITFVNTSLNLVDCSLKMSGVMFVNSSNDAFSLNFSRGFTGTISISGCTLYNISGSGIKIRGDSVNLNITDTFFTENKLRKNSLESALLSISPQSLSAQIQVNLKNINVLRNNCSGKACMEIRSGRNGLIIMQMKFGSIDNNCARESVIDIRGTSVISLTKIHFRQNIGRAINIRDGNSVQLEITRSTFFENKMATSMEDRDGGALSVKGFRQEALVFMSRTLFRSNAGINGGACAFTELTLLKLDIKRCHFIQNEGSGTSAASGGALAVGTMDSHLNNATINIHDSNFTGNKIYSVDHSPSLSGGGAMALYVNYMKDLILINTRFIENAAEHKVAQNDILVQFRGFLKIDSCTIQHNFGGGLFFQHAGDVSLENTLISDNDNFMISLNAGIKRNASFKLTNVSLLRNNCRGKSNIFHVSMNQSPYSLRFQGSAFEDNFCQSGVVEISGTSDHCLETSVNSLGAIVAMNNTLFRGNSGVAKSALSIINADVIRIENCSFKNNFGGAYGSHLSVQLRSTRLTIFKTKFYQSEKSNIFNTTEEQPYNGFLKVTSFGNVSVTESSFISDPLSYDGEGLIFVEGANNVSIDHSVKIKSPVGSKLIFHNFPHWKTINKKTTWVTWFSILTKPCSISTYSIKRGSSRGLKMGHNVKCLPCPNGGNCTREVAARPNFWGYPMGDTVHFQLCPHGYCCPAVNQNCPYYNESYQKSGCQGNRTGILCGSCKENFSEALFHTNCARDEECTHLWYLIVFFICAMLFAFYLIRKPPVFQKIMKMLTWFISSNSRKDYHDVNKSENGQKAIATSSFSSHGYLKILFYFYQVAGLLTVPSYGAGELLTDKIVFPITSIFDFKLYPHSDWNICPFAGLTPLTKTLTQVFVVMAIFLAILFIYLLHSGLNKLRKRTPVFPLKSPYLGAILESVLLGYSAVTGTTMRLLYCVEIQHVHRWYYNAEITCYQWWQKSTIAVIILFLFPFIFMLYDGSLRLHRRQISAKKFLLACVFPLPYLLYAGVVYLKKALKWPLFSQELKSKSSIVDLKEDRETSLQCSLEASILEVLSAPFSKQNQDDQTPGKIYWESILIGRRFILILIGWFMTQTFLRSVCLAITCLIFLLHHLHTKPFAKYLANLAETVSLATLVVIAILNVGVASYYSAGTEYQGLQKQHVYRCVWAEAILLGVIPLTLIIFLALLLMSQFVRLMMGLIKLIHWVTTRLKRARHEEGVPLIHQKN